MEGRSPLHVITAYGLGNEWVRWTIAHGGLVNAKRDVVLAEDFGDAESRDRALTLFPGLRIAEGKRMDMHARPL